MCYMRNQKGQVGVRELRQNLSVYLRRVKRGEALEVMERGQVVAVLVPLKGTATPLERLTASGRVTASAGRLLELGKPLGRRASNRVSRSLNAVRADRL
jgi:prevent-host-death family protein